MIGSTELIVIVLIIFILFGAKSIPKFAKSIGEARKEFQKGMDESNATSDGDTNATHDSKESPQNDSPSSPTDK